MALQPYVPPGTGSSGAIVSYTGQQISAEEREKRIKDVRRILVYIPSFSTPAVGMSESSEKN